MSEPAVEPLSSEEHEKSQDRTRHSDIGDIFAPMHMSYDTGSFHLLNRGSRILGSGRGRNSLPVENKDRVVERHNRRARETISSEESWRPSIRQKMSFSVSVETSVSYVASITGSAVQDMLHESENEDSCEEFVPDAVGLMEHETKSYKVTASEEQLMQDDARSTNTIVFFADLVRTERKSIANELLTMGPDWTDMPPRRAQWTQENIRSAMESVERGQLTQRGAADLYNIPRRTLRNHLKSGSIIRRL
ncbi:unnamed protein product [Acanthoscelides obtectus]|uniref:HTH psq-type domain-containing protein n=1 Tax=Acanthoscelides obtectus TaxID=200917 RepID=A0A9P0L6F4_ACAOB|nr:unnamed protein product [Acanthoscelides obtectus]CAK1624638.1 hypothetical protein AOBTE_LOCUS2668 [Acanthoscelides obtectus]